MTSKKPTKPVSRGKNSEKSVGFSDEERAAMKERARELKAEARAGKNKADGESTVLATIAELPEPDRKLGRHFHDLVRANAPDLTPKLWYGMPAYANKEGKVVCFFQAAAKFKTRYASFAFTDASNLDEGEDSAWTTGFGMKSVNARTEAMISALIRKAVS